ncbi:methanol/ethanol family PQQ-dependent dehydrogenase [Methylobacillus sp. Pita1]|uniref:methanol/ethanol family PQQ-dependent dehydrogenase n=1 Tax=Methylobacillus sp. Pita1 TaxID=3382642 RepID=UPI0038B6612D
MSWLPLIAGCWLSFPGLSFANAFAGEKDGEWPMAANNYASTRYSALSDINTANVHTLKPVVTFSTGVNRGHEAAPLVINNTMYIVTPYPNYLYALDLNKPGAPQKWKFDPQPQSAAQGVACCDFVNRGAAYAEGRVFINTLDNQTIAVDAEDGKEIWRTRMGDIKTGETMTMAPLVVNGKVLVGNSGGEFGVRGWLAALDAKSGKELWRAWSTGPDKDVLIGSNFKPYYASDRGKDLGLTTWPGLSWQNGGGNVWGWISFDPALNLIYYGTGNPGPWNPEQRPGDNKWTAGIFARNPDTGEARWFYQFSPHDLHDYDAINENILIDAPVKGRERKLLIRPERNGYIYVLDRTTGQVLSADPFVRVTTSAGVDLKSGRIRYNPAKEPRVGETIRDICPVSPGAKDWQPSSYSPRTGLIYIPHQNMCQDAQSYNVSYIAGTPYVGSDTRMYAGLGGNLGVMTAWDPLSRKKKWDIRETFPVWSGTLATAGDLVFYGTMEGWFKAVDAQTGKLLWQFKTGSGIVGQPISYRGPDRRQYIAVLSGVGGWAGALVSGELDARDATAAKGFANAVKTLPAHTTRGGMLYVFALP